jgi:hypothetical protein
VKKEPFLYAIAFLMDGSMAVVGLCVPLVHCSLGQLMMTWVELAR